MEKQPQNNQPNNEQPLLLEMPWKEFATGPEAQEAFAKGGEAGYLPRVYAEASRRVRQGTLRPNGIEASDTSSGQNSGQDHDGEVYKRIAANATDPRRILDLQDQIGRAQSKARDEHPFKPWNSDERMLDRGLPRESADSIKTRLRDEYVARILGVDVASFPDKQAASMTRLNTHPDDREFETFHGAPVRRSRTDVNVKLSERGQHLQEQLESLRAEVDEQLDRPRAELEREAVERDKAEMGPINEARTDGNSPKIRDIDRKGLSPLALAKIDALPDDTPPKKGNNKRLPPLTDEELARIGAASGNDGGAEADNGEAEHAEQRRRSRLALGIGAVGAFFGRRAQAVRNIFRGEPSDGHTSVMGGRLRVEEIAGVTAGAGDAADESVVVVDPNEHSGAVGIGDPGQPLAATTVAPGTGRRLLGESVQTDEQDTQDEEPEQQSEQADNDPGDASESDPATAEASETGPVNPIVGPDGREIKIVRRAQAVKDGERATDAATNGNANDGSAPAQANPALSATRPARTTVGGLKNDFSNPATTDSQPNAQALVNEPGPSRPATPSSARQPIPWKMPVAVGEVVPIAEPEAVGQVADAKGAANDQSETADGATNYVSTSGPRQRPRRGLFGGRRRDVQPNGRTIESILDPETEEKRRELRMKSTQRNGGWSQRRRNQ